MKKILLFYPQIDADTEARPFYCNIPLSVISIAAQIDKTKYEIKILDDRIEKNIYSDFENWVDSTLVCVGISAMTSNQIKKGLQFASFIRKFNPTIPIIWGGWHASLMPEQTIVHDLVDVVVIGPAEFIYKTIVERIERNEPYEDIPDILFKDKNKSIRKTQMSHNFKLSETESIINGLSYVDVNRYIQPIWGHKRVIGYESSKGCPMICKFCSIGAVYKKKWDALPAQRVVNDIAYMYDTYNIDAIHFFDNNLFVNFGRVMDIGRRLYERSIDIKWDGTINVQQFLKLSCNDIVKLMTYGFFRIIVGVESGDEDVLNRIGKKHNNHQVIEMVKRCTENRIMVSLSFMIGFPWDPDKDIKNTIELIEQIKTINPFAEILLFIYSPYCGTQLFDIAEEYGMHFPTTLEAWSQFTYDQINTPWISGNTRRKIDRYIRFFGTKDMTEGMKNFLKNRVDQNVLENN